MIEDRWKIDNRWLDGTEIGGVRVGWIQEDDSRWPGFCMYVFDRSTMDLVASNRISYEEASELCAFFTRCLKSLDKIENDQEWMR